MTEGSGAADEILPAGFVDRLQTILPSECLERYLGDMQDEAPTAFRTNTLKTTPAELWRQLRNDGLHPIPLEWRNDAFLVPSEERRQLTESSAQAEGRLYVQNVSSMIPPVLLDPQRTDWVLDLCAAPGGKTVHLSGLMENNGKISAVDSVRSRFFASDGILNSAVSPMRASTTKMERDCGGSAWNSSIGFLWMLRVLENPASEHRIRQVIATGANARSPR